MRRTVLRILQVVPVLAVIAVASPAFAQLNSFRANAVVDSKLNATAVLGEFTPASTIKLSSQAVTLSLAGTNSFSHTFAAGSLKKTFFGGYTASATSGSTTIYILFQPLFGGQWSYSATIVGFVPGSTSMTVNLQIGSQDGIAAIQPLVL